MLGFLAQQVPTLSTAIWDLLLSSGINGILLAVLIILIPFIILSFKFMFGQVIGVVTELIRTLNSSLISIREELSGIGEKLEVQTSILMQYHNHEDLHENGYVKHSKDAIINLIKKKRESK